MDLAIRAPVILDSRLPEVGTPTGASDVVRTATLGIRESAHTPVSKIRTDILLHNLTETDQTHYVERQLRHGACTDSWHDFHKNPYNETTNVDETMFGLYDTILGLPPLIEGVQFPKSKVLEADPLSLHNENELMIEVFNGFKIGDYEISSECNPEFFSDTLFRRLAARAENNLPDPIFNVRGLEGTNVYNVKLLRKNLDFDSPEYGYAVTNVSALVGENRLTTDDLYTFFGTDNINLLFDAAFMDLSTFIRNCNKGARSIALNSIINREVINDPAWKIYEFTKAARAGAADNISTNTIYDDEPETVEYSEWGLERELNRNMFYTKYNFTLGKLNYTDESLPRIHLNIANKAGTLLHIDDDPHHNNSIKHCLERISVIAQKSASKHEDASVEFQCKRSGDWLQALSCLDIGRKFITYDNNDSHGRGHPKPFTVGGKIILVTHDRVLLYYALLLGIDVIMSYKIVPEKAASDALKARYQAAGITLGGEEEDESYAENYDNDPGRLRKYLIYFESHKRVTAAATAGPAAAPAPAGPAMAAAATAATAAAKKQRKIDTLFAKKTKIEQTNTLGLIDTYNSLINEITHDIEMEIADQKARSLVTKTKRGTAKAIALCYIQLGASPYKCIDKADYAAHLAIIQGITVDNINAESEALLEEFISVHDNLMMRLNVYNTKEKLEVLNLKYKKSPMVKHLKHLTSLTKANWIAEWDLEISAESLMLELGTFYIENLSKNLLRNLVYDLQAIADDQCKGECLLNKLLTQIRVLVPAGLLDDLVTRNNTPLVPCGQSGGGATLVNSSILRDIYMAIMEEEKNFHNVLSKSKSQSNKVINENISNSEKVTNLRLTINNTIGLIGQKLCRDYSGNTSPIISHTFVIFYLRTLLSSIAGFEHEGNDDYKYFETLACVVLAICPAYTRQDDLFYNKIQAVLFDRIPDEDLVVTGTSTNYIIGMRGYAALVQFAGRQVALQSLGMRTGDIVGLGNSGEISPSVKQNYKRILQQISGLRFTERKDFLKKNLLHLIFTYRQPALETAASASAAAVPMLTRKMNSTSNNSRRLIPKIAKSVSIGNLRPIGKVGGKTRRRQRKTRRSRK